MYMEDQDDLFDGSQKQGIRAERSREMIQWVIPVLVESMWVFILWISLDLDDFLFLRLR